MVPASTHTNRKYTLNIDNIYMRKNVKAPNHEWVAKSPRHLAVLAMAWQSLGKVSEFLA